MKKFLLYILTLLVPLFAMAQGDTLERRADDISLAVKSDKAHIIVSVSGDYEIYIDNEYKGNSSWSGVVATGVHTFEARKDGYESTSIRRNVKPASESQTFELATPMPKWGAIEVGGIPVNAKVYIDGTYVGRTPLKMPVLVGERKVEVRNNSYRDYHLCKMTIEEGKTSKLYSPLVKRDGYKGFESIVEFTSMVGCGNQYKYVGVNYVAGYRFNPYLYLGGGTGILHNHVKKNWGEDFSHGLPYEPGESYWRYDFFNLNKVSIPLFAYWKLNFSDTNWSPFFVLAGGGYLSPKRSLYFYEYGWGLYKTSGLFINPQFGLDIRSRANIYFHFAFGFQCFGAPYCVDMEPYYAVVKQEDAWGLDFHVGITF